MARRLLGVVLPAAALANRFGTTPFQDEVYSGPQALPGRVRLAYWDLGGAEVAYHSYDNHNHGSCDLNPCDGQYKNVFRQDEGASTSYTKPPNGGWPGDRFAGNLSHVPVDQMYWGWLAVGNWVRTSVDFAAAGTYSGTIMATCNSGGEVTVTVDYDDETVESRTAVFHLPSTAPPGEEGYHVWAQRDAAFQMELPAAGRAVVTVNVTGIDNPPPQGQLGNIMWIDFDLQQAVQQAVVV